MNSQHDLGSSCHHTTLTERPQSLAQSFWGLLFISRDRLKDKVLSYRLSICQLNLRFSVMIRVYWGLENSDKDKSKRTEGPAQISKYDCFCEVRNKGSQTWSPIVIILYSESLVFFSLLLKVYIFVTLFVLFTLPQMSPFFPPVSPSTQPSPSLHSGHHHTAVCVYGLC